MDSIEEWKEIEGFERYYISNKGNIKSTIGKEKILHQYILPNGYVSVKLRRDNKSYNRFIHRLVAIAFIDTDDKSKEVHHKNKNRSDNNVDNLQWVSTEEHRKLHSKEPAAQFLKDTKGEEKTFDCGQPTIENHT